MKSGVLALNTQFYIFHQLSWIVWFFLRTLVQHWISLRKSWCDHKLSLFCTVPSAACRTPSIFPSKVGFSLLVEVSATLKFKITLRFKKVASAEASYIVLVVSILKEHPLFPIQPMSKYFFILVQGWPNFLDRRPFLEIWTKVRATPHNSIFHFYCIFIEFLGCYSVINYFSVLFFRRFCF